MAKSPEDKFVDEYIKDRDPYAAGLRAGVSKIALRTTVRRWMRTPEVQRKIHTATLGQDPLNMVPPQWVLAKLMENASSPIATISERSRALSELALLTGMRPKNEPPKKPGSEHKQRSGVLLVPADAPMDAWEQQATDHQRELKAEVRK